MFAWVRRRLRRLHAEGERGTVIVITAVALSMFLASGAYALDSSQGRAAQQKAQSAADAAALAAALAIPANNTSTNVATVTTAGLNMATTNMPEARATITMPTPTTVLATVSGSSSNPIGLAGSSSSSPVSASAGAGAKNVGGTPGAIFAAANGCSVLNYPGVNLLLGAMQINGNVTTNGSVTAALFAAINITGTMTYGCGTATLLGTITAGANVQGPNNSLFPIDYASTYPNVCTNPPAGTTVKTVGNNGLGQAVVDNTVLATTSGPTIFCSTLPMQITAASANTGAYTFVAPSLSINVASVAFTPALPSLPSFWATTGSVSYLIASASSGTVFAPNGNISFTVAGGTITGYMEAQQVLVTAAGVTLNGNGPTTGGTQRAVLTS